MRGFTADAIENARRRYEESNEFQHSIAADLGVHRKTLDRLAKDRGWNLRKDRPPRDLSSAARLAIEAEQAIRAKIEGGAPSDAREGLAEGRAGADAPGLPSIAERLERAVEKELTAVEVMRALGGPHAATSADAERTARTLASLTDTLYRVQRLRDPQVQMTGSDDFDDMPRDIDEFRRTLAHRIEAFVRSRTDGAVPEPGNVSGTDSPAS